MKNGLPVISFENQLYWLRPGGMRKFFNFVVAEEAAKKTVFFFAFRLIA